MRNIDRLGFLFKIHDEGLSPPTVAPALLRGATVDREVQYRDLLSGSAIDLAFKFGHNRPCMHDSVMGVSCRISALQIRSRSEHNETET